MTAGTLGGSIQLADIHVDAQGEVETVQSELSAASALIDVTSRIGRGSARASQQRHSDAKTDPV